MWLTEAGEGEPWQVRLSQSKHPDSANALLVLSFTFVCCCAHDDRLGVSEAGGSTADLLFVPASEDPLACLLDMQLDQHQGLSGMTDSSYNPAAVDILDHPLMLTDDVRSLLAVLAPWLASQQPFLLVGCVALFWERWSHGGNLHCCFLTS